MQKKNKKIIMMIMLCLILMTFDSLSADYEQILKDITFE